MKSLPTREKSLAVGGDHLVELERAARLLEPGRQERARLMALTTGYIDGFIDALPEMPGFVEGECERLKHVAVGEQGASFDSLLDLLRTEVNHVGINSSSGACFGYIPGGGLWASAVGDLLAAATNRYAGVFFSSPGAVLIENQMVRWLCTVVGYPATAHGNLASGGSIGNLTAIQTARDARKIDSTNVRTAVVYLTAHAHHCIPKALHTTGLDECIVRTVPMNARYQMDVGALGAMLADDAAAGLRPFLVIASAGTTDAGAVDPLDAVADLCEARGAWFHVDAAYGGFFLLVESLREKFKGIERSDSVVLDPHKGMFLPFGTGVVLVRDSSLLLDAFSHDAHYMQDAAGFDEISPADVGPELTRHFRGLRLWLPLHLHGTAPFRACLEEKSVLCRRFYEGVQRLGFEVGPEPELSIALFRSSGSDGEAFDRSLLAAIQKDGRSFFSSTVIDGRYWLRCAVLNFRSHLRDIDLALRVVGENARALRASG
jgi:aromatic-L-amino-acid decarboxylase